MFPLQVFRYAWYVSRHFDEHGVYNGKRGSSLLQANASALSPLGELYNAFNGSALGAAGDRAGVRSFNILDFGAVPGGVALCTAALQAAVAAASAASPAEVLVPSGTFLSGSFALASGVVLRLARGALLLASAALADYPAAGFDWDPALIDTHNATGTGVVGEGTVDGQAPPSTAPHAMAHGGAAGVCQYLQALPLWVDHYDPARGWVPRTWAGEHGCVGECRPKLLRFTDCAHVAARLAM